MSRGKKKSPSLDKILESVSVRPLLSEGRSVSHCGKVTKPKPVLHAFIPARHLLLFGLREIGRI